MSSQEVQGAPTPGSEKRALKREESKQKQEAEAAQQRAPPAPSQLEQISACCRWQVWPWWVALVAAIYCLTKLHLLYESPCAVLATSSPVSRGDISKAYRSISMCTHPDRLISASTAQRERGVILFKRVTAARDELLERVRESGAGHDATGEAGGDTAQATASCMSSAFEQQALAFARAIVGELGELGAAGVLSAAKAFATSLITFEAGITHSISICLLLMMLFRMLRAVVGALTSAPPLLLLASALASLTLGPIPTLLRFLLVPLFRIRLFASRARAELRGAETDGADDAPTAGPPPPPPLPPPAAAAERGALPRNARNKRGGADKRPLSAAEQQQREQAAILGQGPGQPKDGGQDAALAEAVSEGGLAAMPSALREVVAMRGPGGGMSAATARAKAAEIVQFDVLLALTKPIFPLLTLLATGEVYNGLIFVLVTTRLLRQIPFVGVEGLHLACAASGFLHTVLGVSANAISSHQRGLLQLAWSWSLKDVAMIANVALTGATFSSLGRLGNEPLLVCSFASGVAARLLVLELVPQAWLPDLNPHFAAFKVQFAPVADVGVRSRGSVGSCAGGILRWIAGDYSPALALGVKGLLLLLPLLSAAQWTLRTERNAHKLHRAGARRRFVGSLLLGALALAQVGLLVVYNLDAINGPLPNFWTACLLGALFESLLATYNVLGRMRSFVGWFLYILL